MLIWVFFSTERKANRINAEINISSNDRLSATPRLVSKPVKITSGIVCVKPCRLPAKMMVAQNSPNARAQLRISPFSMDRTASGTITCQKISRSVAPSV